MAYYLLVKVRESDGLGEPLVHQVLHGSPGLHIVGLHVSAVVALVVQGEHALLAVVGGETSIWSQGANLA